MRFINTSSNVNSIANICGYVDAFGVSMERSFALLPMRLFTLLGRICLGHPICGYTASWASAIWSILQSIQQQLLDFRKPNQTALRPDPTLEPGTLAIVDAYRNRAICLS